MTFSRIKVVGWQVNEKVTSPQLNQLDLDHFNSLDKTGDNSTNGGGITGRIDIQSGAQLRTNSGGAINIETGGGVFWFGASVGVFNNTSNLGFNDTSGLTFNGTGNLIMGSGSSFLAAGTTNITSGGTLGLNSGATMHVKSGATETVDNGGTLALAIGGAMTAASGSNTSFNAGSFVTATNQTTTFTGASQLVLISSGCTMITTGTSFITVASGSTLTVASGATLQTHGTHLTDVWGTWNSAQTRQVIMSTTDGIAVAGSWVGGLQFVYSTAVGGAWVSNLNRCHHGALLANVFVSLSVGTSHSAVPAVLPSLSIVRYRWDNMFSAQALSTTDPQFFPNLGSGAAYYNSGNQQFMTYVCNQNATIDNENYIYVLTITDESGANSHTLNAYGLITLEHQVITNQKWNT